MSAPLPDPPDLRVDVPPGWIHIRTRRPFRDADLAQLHQHLNGVPSLTPEAVQDALVHLGAVTETAEESGAVVLLVLVDTSGQGHLDVATLTLTVVPLPDATDTGQALTDALTVVPARCRLVAPDEPLPGTTAPAVLRRLEVDTDDLPDLVATGPFCQAQLFTVLTDASLLCVSTCTINDTAHMETAAKVASRFGTSVRLEPPGHPHTRPRPARPRPPQQ